MDGGFYDNAGLETLLKRYNAGGKTQPETGRPRHAMRVFDVIDDQALSRRKRQLIDSYRAGILKRAYWGIRINFQNYAVPAGFRNPHEHTPELDRLPYPEAGV